MTTPIVKTELDGIELVRRGKVRDIYELPEGLLIVATDRLSAFDVVFSEGIPGKGAVLTAVTTYWFEELESLIDNHLITADVDEMPEAARRHRDVIAGRSMLVKKAEVVPLECVARGYLAGSAYKAYQKTGSICGIPLPEGLSLSARLPAPIFTPSTKAEVGHDENITFEQAAEIAGRETAERLRSLTLALYEAGAENLAAKGILLCDTKFEFGRDADGALMLIDEALTPDSSRFWDESTYEVGRAQDSFDKQIVRDYVDGSGWDKKPPPPALPPDIVEKAAARYREIARRITGKAVEVQE